MLTLIGPHGRYVLMSTKEPDYVRRSQQCPGLVVTAKVNAESSLTLDCGCLCSCSLLSGTMSRKIPGENASRLGRKRKQKDKKSRLKSAKDKSTRLELGSRWWPLCLFNYEALRSGSIHACRHEHRRSGVLAV